MSEHPNIFKLLQEAVGDSITVRSYEEVIEKDGDGVENEVSRGTFSHRASGKVKYFSMIGWMSTVPDDRKKLWAEDAAKQLVLAFK